MTAEQHRKRAKLLWLRADQLRRGRKFSEAATKEREAQEEERKAMELENGN